MATGSIEKQQGYAPNHTHDLVTFIGKKISKGAPQVYTRLIYCNTSQQTNNDGAIMGYIYDGNMNKYDGI